MHFRADGPSDPEQHREQQTGSGRYPLAGEREEAAPLQMRPVSQLQQRQTDAQNGPLAGDAEFAAKQAVPVHTMQVCWPCGFSLK